MSDINKAILKVARSNPEFAKALTAELKSAGSWSADSKKIQDAFRAAQIDGQNQVKNIDKGDDSAYFGYQSDQEAEFKKIVALLRQELKDPNDRNKKLIADLLILFYYNGGIVKHWGD